MIAVAWSFTDAHALVKPKAHATDMPVNPAPDPTPPDAPLALPWVNAPVKPKSRASHDKRLSHAPVKALTHNPRALVELWVTRCIAPDAGGRVRVGDAYEGFAAWCEREGHPALREQAFYNAASSVLRTVGGNRERDGRRGMAYSGLRMRG